MHARLTGFTAMIAVSLHLTVSAAEFSLDMLIDTALATSKTLQSVSGELRIAESQVREARGNAYPKITASANLSHSFDEYIPYSVGGVSNESFLQSLSTAYTQAGENPELGLTGDEQVLLNKFGPTISGVTISELMALFDGMFETPANTAAFSLSVNQALYAQGKIGIGVRIANSYKNTLQKKYDGEKHKIISSVTGAYLSGIMARNNVEIQKVSVSLATETHRLTLVRHAIGKGTELDTLTSRLRLENAKIDLEQAQSDCRMAYEALMLLCGLGGSTDSLVINGELPVPQFDLTLEKALEKLHLSNDQIKQLESAEVIQNELIKLAKTEYRPLVYASGSYSRIGMFDGFDGNTLWGNDCKVAVGISMELFSGFIRRQKISQKVEERNMFVLSRKQATEALELATLNAFEKVPVSANRYRSMSSVTALAQKGYLIAKKSFEIGSGTQLDMQNAELEYNRSRLACNAALLGFNLAHIELKELMGDF